MSDYVLLTEKTHKARKPYICCHCAEPILKNEKYVFTSGAIGGTIQADRWHTDCRSAISNFWSSWTPGSYQRGTLKRRWGEEAEGRVL
jgi:hypothetical protein